MERLINLETNDTISSMLFLTNDIAEANMLRRAILSEIETYTIDIVIFETNTSPRDDEVIALRLGQLVIDHSRFQPSEIENFKYHINVKGPGEFTTNDIPDIPFTYLTPIATLREGQSIVCDVIVKQGIAREHVKYRPVSKVIMKEIPNTGYQMTIKNIGMLPSEDIFKKGYEKMKVAATRQPINLFFHPLVPRNL